MGCVERGLVAVEEYRWAFLGHRILLFVRVRSIGEGAGLMVAENDRGAPWLTPWKAPPSSRGSAEDSFSEPEGTCIAPGANAPLPGPRHGEASP